MRLKTKQLVMILAFLTMGIMVKAQEVSVERFAKLPPKERAQKLTDVMTRRLSLSDDQSKSVYDINLKYAEMNEQVKGNLEKLKANNDARNEEMKGVLTPDQFAKLQKMEEKVKQRVKERVQERRASKGV